MLTTFQNSFHLRVALSPPSPAALLSPTCFSDSRGSVPRSDHSAPCTPSAGASPLRLCPTRRPPISSWTARSTWHYVFLLSMFPNAAPDTARDSLQITRQLLCYFKGCSMTHSVSLLEYLYSLNLFFKCFALIISSLDTRVGKISLRWIPETILSYSPNSEKAMISRHRGGPRRLTQWLISAPLTLPDALLSRRSGPGKGVPTAVHRGNLAGGGRGVAARAFSRPHGGDLTLRGDRCALHADPAIDKLISMKSSHLDG